MVLGRIAGIRIRVNLFFLLLCGVYTYLGLGWEIFTIFFAVLIHELGHTVIARVLGVEVAEIELLPFGGQARIEDFTGLDPGREIYIALAGPLISLSLAGAFYFIPSLKSSLVPLFVNINLCLALFNLLPALPLDGGRVLRALLSGMIGYKKATAYSARLGKMVALGISIYGGYLIYYRGNGVNFLVLGFLLFWAAHREGKLLVYAFMRYLVHKKGELSRKGYLAAKQMVCREDTLVKAMLEITRPSYYLLITVMDEEHHLTGLLSEAELIECLLEKGPNASLKDC